MKKDIRVPLRERFFKKVTKADGDGCWLWTGVKTAKGYGQIRLELTHQLDMAHRVSYKIHKGPIPPGMLVMHDCDTPGCVNPAHLSLGTYSDNMQDLLFKGRGNMAKGERAGKSKLTEAAVRTIRASQASLASLATQFGVLPCTVYCARTGRSWSHITNE